MGQKLFRIIIITAREEVPMPTARVRAPPIIHHHRLPHRTLIVQPGQEARLIPVLASRLPLSVRPQHLRLVTHNQIDQLGQRFRFHEVLLLEAGRLVAQVEGIEPLQLAMVQSEANFRVGPEGTGQLAH